MTTQGVTLHYCPRLFSWMAEQEVSPRAHTSPAGGEVRVGGAVRVRPRSWSLGVTAAGGQSPQLPSCSPKKIAALGEKVQERLMWGRAAVSAPQVVQPGKARRAGAFSTALASGHSADRDDPGVSKRSLWHETRSRYRPLVTSPQSQFSPVPPLTIHGKEVLILTRSENRTRAEFPENDQWKEKKSRRGD